MKYCSNCGRSVSTRIPAGDNRPRAVCGECGTVHYVNPKLVVGCVPEFQGQILLCRRAIEPRRGFWTVPAGFMEIGETLAEAALRETWEEALARVEIGRLFSIVDVVHARQVHVFFEGRLLLPEFGAGFETLETRLYSPQNIPWPELAFRSIWIALEQYLEDGRSGNREVRLSAAPGSHPA
ncbi:MAG: NUDIX hydrolase [Gammaproteobacteria bacterium]|nr:NUDIX hydrolase [Gammaproteobacteria bacterium]